MALIGLVIIGIIISGGIMFTSMGKCDDKECFNNALAKCNRVSYFNDGTDTSILYQIKGKSENTCKVDVKLIQFKRGTADLAVLQGQSMTCITPLGVVVAPEQNLANCHGLLKEAIQDMIIQKLHTQITQNIGKIGEEVTKVL